MACYDRLHKAQVTFDYLHTNSITHEFIFGAFAELIDNSLDAKSSCLYIFTEVCKDVRGGISLCFLDNGYGMTMDEVVNVISFGRSEKCSVSDDGTIIGQYGNGLKSGSMRLGKDMMLFTKRNNELTCLMLSRTFHESEGIEEVVVPIPVFDVNTFQPILKAGKTRNMHNTELTVIFKYSPFKNLDIIKDRFDKITGSSGTLIVVFNLALLDSGKTEIDVKTDPYDIMLTNENITEAEADLVLYPERYSLRKYVSILYYEPRMKVYIQGKKVQNVRFVNTLLRPREYTFSSVRFKSKTEKQLEAAIEAYNHMEDRVRETESKLVDMRPKAFVNAQEPLNSLKMYFSSNVDLVLEIFARLFFNFQRFNLPTYGINIHNRRRDGVFIYNRNRLITMYEKDIDLNVPGIVGVINIPQDVIEPTHNKQGFANNLEYRYLLRNIMRTMSVYVFDTKYRGKDEVELWLRCGYPANKEWSDVIAPSDEPKFVRKRNFGMNVVAQCDKCLKWRVYAYGTPASSVEVPSDWECSMNADPDQNDCDLPERLPEIQKGTVPKDINLLKSKSVEDLGNNEDENCAKGGLNRSVRFLDGDVEKSKVADHTAQSKPRSILKKSYKRQPFLIESSTSQSTSSSEDSGRPVEKKPRLPRRKSRVHQNEDDDYRPPSYGKKSAILYGREVQVDTIIKLSKSVKTLLSSLLPENGELTEEQLENMSADSLVGLDVKDLMTKYKAELMQAFDNNRARLETIQGVVSQKEKLLAETKASIEGSNAAQPYRSCKDG
ncbi:hypothetical protein ACOME3_008233 [Neoechinorhynchus agilis]